MSDSDVWTEPAVRAHRDVVCKGCGKAYWRHQQPLPDEVPTLRRICDGTLVKL